ncbi:Prefoldin [Melanomma pulvis-pyrius CBS 109.77]|uniref:Prefoldin n=1 Tax=Melanomma pulvis-pyrius CBS 109.77 TaxID=1314802 RepID=A0A6A6XWD4_9PLEO|nr:Prefoldin [Melanomma pulvis-pyrius CBS 109.77]
MGELQKKLQGLSDDYQQLQRELSTAIEARQQLESQQQENTTVKKVRLHLYELLQEFSLLDDDANIYKQIGPVLLKQDKTEAVMAVNGRLEFIEKEIKRVETQIEGIQGKSETVKIEVCIADSITIIVGSDSDTREIIIHKSVLTSTSKFFSKALRSEWSDLRANPNTIELPHLDMDTFKVYTHWLYSRTLALPTDGKDHQAYPLLAKAYVLGEEFMDIAFKNDVLDTMIAIVSECSIYPAGETVLTIYENTPPASPARRLLVDFVAGAGDPTWVAWIDKWPRQFLIDATKALLERRHGVDVARPWLDSCQLYHEEELTE